MAERWYVIEAYEGRDFDVCLALARAGFEVWRPVVLKRITARASESGKIVSRRTIKTARFGRYLFLRCEMSLAICSAIESGAGVRGILRGGGEEMPTPVAEQDMRYLRQYAAAGETAFFADIEVIEIARGDKVALKDGPFAGHLALVKAVDKMGVAHLEVELFGRPTPMICEVGRVALREQGRRPPNQATLKRAAG